MKCHQMQAKRQQQHLSDLLPSKDLPDDPDLRYYLSSSQNDVVPLYTMLHRSGASDDPALKVVIVTGNPGVSQSYPYPYPRLPVPVLTGTGFNGLG
jgi:hypothetical protein